MILPILMISHLTILPILMFSDLLNHDFTCKGGFACVPLFSLTAIIGGVCLVTVSYAVIAALLLSTVLLLARLYAASDLAFNT